MRSTARAKYDQAKAQSMGGLIIATVLTRIFLPALYAAWFRVKAEAVPSPSTAAYAAGQHAHAS